MNKFISNEKGAMMPQVSALGVIKELKKVFSHFHYGFDGKLHPWNCRISTYAYCVCGQQ